MKRNDLVLGIDTSNYKTSIALVDAETGSIRCDLRRLLRVKQGERGLRQSDALFQHIENIPELMKQAFQTEAPMQQQSSLVAVAYSSRPRPVENSYMPVFRAGETVAKSLAAAMGIPLFAFSHQEGHVEAIRSSSRFSREEPLLCYHLSGGTSELLKLKDGRLEKIGGSKDLAFGQVIDRVGVAAGMAFPAGEEMDRLVGKQTDAEKAAAPGELKKIPLDGLYWNLSGIETQCSRKITATTDPHQQNALMRELFEKIATCLIQLTDQAVKQEDIKNIMFTGGVASSKFISERIKTHFHGKNICVAFGAQHLAQDNAVGIALLGRNALWQ